MIIKRRNPSANVYVIYRDIRAYGLNEINYRAARKAGIQFLRYEPGKEPVVRNDEAAGRLIVEVDDVVLNDTVRIDAGMVVLGSAIIPPVEVNREVARMLKVPLNQDGFFLEAHVKLRPVDFATDGVYLCGLAHAPKNLRESIVQGKAAAARAATVISKDWLEAEGTIAQVNEALCAGCGACEQVCAYKAVSVQEQKKRDGSIQLKAVVNGVLCKGCGTCSATCRCGAIDVNGFTDRQVVSEIESLVCGG